MAAKLLIALLLAASSPLGEASGATKSETALKVNPIRKVVTMLQNMQAKITKEGEKKEKIYDEFMCYCKNGDEALAKSIADAETKIPQMEASIKEDAAMKLQLESELKEAKSDREQAKEDVAKAMAIREKEEKAFKAVSAESTTNIAALSKAIPAIEQGMASSFLQAQTGAAATLRRLSETAEMENADRDLLSSFLQDGDSSSYAPKSGEIVGILKTLKDEMEKDLSEATATEKEAAASCEASCAAKKKEIESLTKAIESKTTRVGELAVKVATVEDDVEDTKESLAEDKKFLADLEKNCATKEAEWEEYKKVEAQEMVALADTIKVLNDDDALELFKKTLPAAGSSFVQLQVTSSAMRKRALSVLKAHKGKKDHRLDFVQVALHGGKMGFDKIIKMIDGLVVTLKAEQATDDEKKAYCLAEFDKTEDTKKELTLDMSDLEKAIADGKETVATLASEIEALTDGIKALDDSVAEATSTRKKEHEDFVETLASNNAAKDLLGFAKNRLNKFYNPKLYKAPPKRELSEEEQLTVSMGGTLAPTAAPGGIAGTGIGLVQVHNNAAPPPPPARHSPPLCLVPGWTEQ